MTAAEIIRRLRAMKVASPFERACTFYQLGKLSGIRPDHLSQHMATRTTLREHTRARLERAFTLIENGQIRKLKGMRKKGQSYLAVDPEPKPVQSMLRRIRMTADGPVIEFVPANLRAMPELPPILK